jgi:hypothetical protein
VEYNCALKPVDWFAACIALSVVGAVLVDFLWRWRKICPTPSGIGKQGPMLADQLKARKPGLSHASNIIYSGFACCLYCTKSGWRCIGCFSLALASNLHNPPGIGKQGPILAKAKARKHD